jgi:hypothetical protein
VFVRTTTGMAALDSFHEKYNDVAAKEYSCGFLAADSKSLPM